MEHIQYYHFSHFQIRRIYLWCLDCHFWTLSLRFTYDSHLFIFMLKLLGWFTASTPLKISLNEWWNKADSLPQAPLPATKLHSGFFLTTAQHWGGLQGPGWARCPNSKVHMHKCATVTLRQWWGQVCWDRSLNPPRLSHQEAVSVDSQSWAVEAFSVPTARHLHTTLCVVTGSWMPPGLKNICLHWLLRRCTYSICTPCIPATVERGWPPPL